MPILHTAGDLSEDDVYSVAGETIRVASIIIFNEHNAAIDISFANAANTELLKIRVAADTTKTWCPAAPIPFHQGFKFDNSASSGVFTDCHIFVATP